MNAMRIGPPLVVVVAVLAFYWDLVRGATFLWGDALSEYFPGLHYFATNLRAGRFPLWIAEVRNGQPFYTDIQLALFYPPTWSLVPWATPERLPFVAYQVFIVGHIAWAGLGMCWFLRGLGVRVEAQVIGALTLCFGAFMSLHLIHAPMLQGYAWWPWLMELVRRMATRPARATLLGLFGVAAMMFLAGHPQTTLYGLYLATAYWIYLAWPTETRWRAVVMAPAVWVITALILAGVLLPVAENWYWSGRAACTGEAVREGSAPLTNLIGLVAPNFFGTLQATPSPVVFWGDVSLGTAPVAPWNYWEFGNYFGQVGLLAMVVMSLHRSRPAGFFLAALVIGLWLSLGHHGGLFTLAYYTVPGVSLFRVPARMANVTCFCGAVLAALFVHAVCERQPRRLMRAVSVLGLIYAGIIGMWFARVFPLLRDPVVYAWSGQCLMISLAVALGVLVIVALMRRWSSAAFGLIALVYADFALAYGQYHRGQVSADEYYADVQGIISAVRERSRREGPFRVAQFRGEKLAEEVVFPLNIGYMHPGFETPEGYTSFSLRHTARIQALSNFVAKLILQNVGATIRLADPHKPIILAPLPAGQQRARFYGRVRVFPSEEALLAAIERGELDVREEVGIVGQNWPSGDASGGVQFVARSPGEYELHYRVTGPGIIFVSITDYPGWVSDFPMVRTFGAFHGVVLAEAGEGVVRVRFRPRVWRWGCLISGFGLILAAWVIANWSAPRT